MPLSEHEQRLLDQMEQALYDDDPKFVSGLKGKSSQSQFRSRNITLGLLGVLAGLGIIVLAVSMQMPWIGVIGFLAMVLGGGYALTPAKTTKSDFGVVNHDGTTRPAAKKSKNTKARSGGSFMNRLEQRWDKRRGERGF